MRSFWLRIVSLAILGSLFGASRAALITVGNASEFRGALAVAGDGDEIELKSGTYAGGFFARNLTGVTIRSADPSNPAVIDAAIAGEGVKLETADRVTISNLIIQNASQNGINVDDGGFVRPSTDITLRNVVVRNGGGHGIKFTGVDGFLLEQVQVQNWGNGFAGINLLGAQNGLVTNSLVQGNTPGGKGLKAEAGSANITIRANRFEGAGERAIQFGGGVPPGTFRPQPPGNVTASNIVAEGNVVVNSGAPLLPFKAAVSYVNTVDSVFRNNLIYRPGGVVGRILNEQGPGFAQTQNGVFQNNVVVWRNGDVFAAFDDGVSTLPATFNIEGNTWFNSNNPLFSDLRAFGSPGSFDPLSAFEMHGIYGVNPGFGPNDVIPWSFEWGTWAVNATGSTQTISVADPSLFQLAEPGPGARFDIGLPNPLIGNWQLSALSSADVTLDPFSDIVLINASLGNTAIPEPSAAIVWCWLAALGVVIGNRHWTQFADAA